VVETKLETFVGIGSGRFVRRGLPRDRVFTQIFGDASP
jgi:hypothetical protein